MASPELGDMDLEEMDVPPWLRVFLMKRREHWVRSVYLLLEVHEEEADDGRCGVSISRLPESVPCISLFSVVDVPTHPLASSREGDRLSTAVRASCGCLLPQRRAGRSEPYGAAPELRAQPLR